MHLESRASPCPLLSPTWAHHPDARIPQMVQLSFASSVLPILSFSAPAPLKHFMKCQKPFMVIMVSTNRSTDSWHSLQRVELILLPQSVTGLNDLLQMNRVRKKWRCVPSIVCQKRPGGFLLALPWIPHSAEDSCHVNMQAALWRDPWGLQSAAWKGAPWGWDSSPSPAFRWHSPRGQLDCNSLRDLKPEPPSSPPGLPQNCAGP